MVILVPVLPDCRIIVVALSRSAGNGFTRIPFAYTHTISRSRPSKTIQRFFINTLLVKLYITFHDVLKRFCLYLILTIHRTHPIPNIIPCSPVLLLLDTNTRIIDILRINLLCLIYILLSRCCNRNIWYRIMLCHMQFQRKRYIKSFILQQCSRRYYPVS